VIEHCNSEVVRYAVYCRVLKLWLHEGVGLWQEWNILEQIFHDKDSDDSDIELGDDESDHCDADDEQPVADVQDAVDADVLIFSARACRPTLSHGIVL